MFVKQVSIFIENKSGRLADVTRILYEKNINIRALSLADTAEYGILRLIVNEPDVAYETLKDKRFSVRVTDVIAISVGDKPGGLYKALNCLDRNGVSIEYMYAFLGNKDTDKAIVILRIENTQRALEILKDAGTDVLSPEEIYQL